MTCKLTLIPNIPPSTSPWKFKVLKSQVSEVLTGFPTVMFGGNKGMFMIWCEKFRCATIGRYIYIYTSYKIVCDANSICFMMWQDSVPPCPTWENLDPMAAWTPWFRHLNDTVTPSRLLQIGSKVHRRRARWTRVSQSTQLVSTDDAGPRFWIFKFLRGHLLVAGVGPLEKEGIGVALLLKGVTKTPSCMRNVLGNLMTPAILFVALEIKKIRL